MGKQLSEGDSAIIKSGTLPDIERLIVKASKGNRDAQVALFQNIAKDVLSRVRLLYVGGNMMDVEDIAQEVLMRACENIRTLKDPKAFKAWLNRIIINEVRRYAKKLAKQSNVLNLEEYMIEAEIEEEDKDFLPHDFHIRKEENQMIKDVIDSLSDRQREAIVLYYYGSLSVMEIAKIMGISHAGVSLYLKLARKKIKEGFDNAAQKSDRGSVQRLAMLPIGSLLTQMLGHESGQYRFVSEAWIRQAVDQGRDIVISKSGSAMLFKVASMTVVVAPVVAVGFVIGSMLQPEPQALPAAEPQIIFTSNTEYPFLNPVTATIQSGDDVDAMIRQWTITEAGAADVIYSGDQVFVEGQFLTLPDGEYMMTFTLEDSEERIYTVYRKFQIMSNPGRYVS